MRVRMVTIPLKTIRFSLSCRVALQAECAITGGN